METIEKIKQLADEFTTKDDGHYHYRGKECFVKGYVDGYIQCQEDNMDNKYTEEDMIDVFNFLSFNNKSFSEFKEFIKSLNKQD